MTNISSQESTSDNVLSKDRRIGKSNYWVQLTREAPPLAGAWRMAIIQKPARASKSNPPLLLIQFSPLKPLFTLEIDGDSYPLMIDQVKSGRGGKVVVEGSRRIGSKSSSLVKWSADLITYERDNKARIQIDGRFRCTGMTGKPASIRVRVPLVVFQPESVALPLPENLQMTAAAVFAGRAQTAIGLFIPSIKSGGISIANGALVTVAENIDTKGKIPVSLSIVLSSSLSKTDAVHLIRSEAADSAPPLAEPEEDNYLPLMTVARADVRRMQDSKCCTTIGKERWYFRARGTHEYGPGYPFYTAEISPGLIRWTKFFQSEIAERTATLTARGIAADFAVIVGEPGAEGNKGAFWDYAVGEPDSLAFSTYDGRKEYGIASNSRIAYSLFNMLSASRDPLFRQAALNTCHWLLLRQNPDGYYDSPFISSKTGKFVGRKLNLDGVLAIRPLVAAYQTTKSEIFIKSAWNIANFLNSDLLPLTQAPCLYGVGQTSNCPVALSAVIQSLLDLNDEAPNHKLRASLEIIADWLAICQFDDESHTCLNYDGYYSGILECASAALRLFSFTGKERWFRLGYALIERVVSQDKTNWRLADLSITLLLCVAGLIPDASVHLPDNSVTVAWSKFAPDTAAALYYDVRDADQNQIDFLPLVCRDTNQTILTVLAPSNSVGIHVIKRNQISNQRVPIIDLVTSEQCTLDITMHDLPTSNGQYAVIRIDP